MDAAKNAVNKIIGRSGQHDTEIDEHVRPAVTEEVIKPHRHEETTQAVDREVHQHHYHTTVQPLEHKEVLPERHTHQQAPVQEREFHHGDHEKTKAAVDREAAQFADSRTVHQTSHSQSQAAAATGEHVHHHVHETVQPLIQKETLQPEVVHTTVPIHEVHHAQSEHHGLSTLPTKTLSEFKELGGKITGGTQRHEEYEGHPRPYNPAMQTSRADADHAPHKHDGLHGSHGTSGTTGGLTGTSGTTGGLTGTSGTTGGLTGHSDRHTGSGLTGTSGTSAGLTGPGSNTTGGLTGDRHSGTTGGLTGDRHHGTTGGLSGTSGSNVSGSGPDFSTGPGHTLGGAGSTGTALGGRAEGNTASRALEHATSGHGSTGGLGGHHDRGHTDNTTSTSSGNTRDLSEVQSPRQGKDPSLVESDGRSSSEAGLKGQGADGSHSAVFGLTPDGHKYDDTQHATTTLRPAHTKSGENTATGDTGSRAPTGSGVADQLNDPRVNQSAHGGSGITGTSSSGKPGAGVGIGGQQGLGQVRPGQHGAEDKLKNKIDPTTDADGDGKRGAFD